MNSDRQWKILLAAMCLMLIGSAAFAWTQSVRARSLADQNEAGARRALYQSAELLGGLQGSLLKLPASSSSAQKQLLLSDVARQAFGVQENLAALPIDAHGLQGAIRFVNQIQDYASTLSASLAEGIAPDPDPAAQFFALAQTSSQLQQALLASAESLEPLDFTPPEDAGGTKEQAPSVKYPSLIYDGPFSDGISSGPIPLGGGEEFDMARAQQAAVDYVGEERALNTRCIGEIGLPAPCFEFEIETQQETLTVCITKTGGQVLYMMSDAAPAREILSESECIDAAALFLRRRGYIDMQPTYWTRADGFLTINFAAMQDGVLLYPDLIKVEVSMESGLVCASESRTYLANHRPRAIAPPAVSLEQARASLGKQLNVTGSRLCIIPTDTAEALFWEFSADVGNSSYLIYIDALTGRERDILRLVETETGLETQ